MPFIYSSIGLLPPTIRTTAMVKLWVFMQRFSYCHRPSDDLGVEKQSYLIKIHGKRKIRFFWMIRKSWVGIMIVCKTLTGVKPAFQKYCWKCVEQSCPATPRHTISINGKSQTKTNFFYFSKLFWLHSSCFPCKILQILIGEPLL